MLHTEHKGAGSETQKEKGADAPLENKTLAHEVKRRCWQCHNTGKLGGKETRFLLP